MSMKIIAYLFSLRSFLQMQIFGSGLILFFLIQQLKIEFKHTSRRLTHRRV